MRQVRVGVGIFIVRDDGSFLMYQRRGSHGDGDWSTPGGHIEIGETWQQCGAREVREETGINLNEDEIQLVGITNDFFDLDGKQYVTILAKAKWPGQHPVQMEPEKGSAWEWRNVDDLPEPLFASMKNIFKQSISLKI